MKYSFVMLLVILTLSAQEPKKNTRTFSADNALIIREIGAVIVTKNDRLVIDIVLGNTNQLSADIAKDDMVLMANGKKVSTLSDLRQQYEKTKIGIECKIGLQRNGNLLIARFIKKSDEELNASGGQMVMKIQKNDGDEVMPALGLIVGSKNKTVVVNGVLPNASRNFKSVVPAEGNIITSINGRSVSSVDDFVSVYDELQAGDKVTIEFMSKGKKLKETFDKPAPQGKLMMIK